VPASSYALDAIVWRAARYGLDGDLVHPLGGGSRPAWQVVDSLVQQVGDGLEVHGDTDLVAEGLRRVRDRGTGAAVQRRAMADAGGDPTGVVDMLVAATVGTAV
jgi:carboxylate-amine ligase